jgi:hypothetical protein
MELLDGLKTDVADNNGALNEKRAQEAALTEKVGAKATPRLHVRAFSGVAGGRDAGRMKEG